MEHTHIASGLTLAKSISYLIFLLVRLLTNDSVLLEYLEELRNEYEN